MNSALTCTYNCHYLKKKKESQHTDALKNSCCHLAASFRRVQCAAFYDHTVHKHLCMNRERQENMPHNVQPSPDKREQIPEGAIATLHISNGMRFRLHWYGPSIAKL